MKNLQLDPQIMTRFSRLLQKLQMYDARPETARTTNRRAFVVFNRGLPEFFGVAMPWMPYLEHAKDPWMMAGVAPDWAKPAEVPA